jgi:hypothetical protein
MGGAAPLANQEPSAAQSDAGALPARDQRLRHEGLFGSPAREPSYDLEQPKKEQRRDIRTDT